MAYEAFILLPPDSEVKLEDVRRALEKLFADDERNVRFDTAENRVTVTIDDWNLYVLFNSEPYVVEQSREMAESFADERPDKEEIAVSDRRLEITTDDDEEEMEFYDDFLLAAEGLGQEFRSAKVWEAASEEFLDQ